jgi:hypothetical protein
MKQRVSMGYALVVSKNGLNINNQRSLHEF